MSDWKAATSRITFFRTPQQSPDVHSATDLFREFWGKPPDNFQNAPNPFSPSVAEGQRGPLQVGCAVHPVRIDLTIRPHGGAEDTEGPAFPLFNSVGTVYSELGSIISTVGATSPLGGISRV